MIKLIVAAAVLAKKKRKNNENPINKRIVVMRTIKLSIMKLRKVAMKRKKITLLIIKKTYENDNGTVDNAEMSTAKELDNVNKEPSSVTLVVFSLKKRLSEIQTSITQSPLITTKI